MEHLSDYYHKTIQIWNSLCDLHKELFEITSQEYLKLLSSDVDAVEQSIKDKQIIIDKISKIDIERAKHVKMINESLNTKIQNFFDLSDFFQDIEIEKKNGHLNKYNLLLRELIKNIQVQNKTNQQFINRAIMNLNEIKNAGSRNKSYSLYNSNGALKK